MKKPSQGEKRERERESLTRGGENKLKGYRSIVILKATRTIGSCLRSVCFLAVLAFLTASRGFAPRKGCDRAAAFVLAFLIASIPSLCAIKMKCCTVNRLVTSDFTCFKDHWDQIVKTQCRSRCNPVARSSGFRIPRCKNKDRLFCVLHASDTDLEVAQNQRYANPRSDRLLSPS